MYFVIVAATLLVLPALSIFVESRTGNGSVDALLMAKWFTFWAVGVRLFVAGLRQVVQPRYTASVILGLKGDEVLILVRELGFANLAIGSIGLLSLALPGWVPAAALAGGLFYGFAGVGHIFHAHRNKLQNVAMISDLMISVLLICLVLAAASNS